MIQSVLNNIRPSRITEVVDIGANPIDGNPPYYNFYHAGLCSVTGFEPQPEAYQNLLKIKGKNQTFLPYAVGDGDVHQLNICASSGMSSLLEPDSNNLALFKELIPHAEVIERQSIDTKKLDDIEEIKHLDFLKMDIQGSELSVFKSGRKKLSETVAIQVEISFITLYKEQPSFGEIDLELRNQGFVPHCFHSIKPWPVAPFFVPGNTRRAINQLLEGDLVYLKDFSDLSIYSSDQVKHLALICHYVYGSADITLRCINELAIRKEVEQGLVATYRNSLAI